jgi:phosphoenolpyruvate synthase/pyruvate phosphate dikinase
MLRTHLLGKFDEKAASGFIANQLHADGGMQKMIESMQKEIGKRFLKGIAASRGIVIGKAYVFQDILLRVERRDLEESRAEKEIVHLNQAIRQVIDELIEDNFQI